MDQCQRWGLAVVNYHIQGINRFGDRAYHSDRVMTYVGCLALEEDV